MINYDKKMRVGIVLYHLSKRDFQMPEMGFSRAFFEWQMDIKG